MAEPRDIAAGTSSSLDTLAIHRYVLIEEVGAGAMGVVYAAHDYGLDRKVALKLVRDPGKLGPEHPDVIAFLSGEGSALYELGRYDDAEAVFQRGLTQVEKMTASCWRRRWLDFARPTTRSAPPGRPPGSPPPD